MSTTAQWSAPYSLSMDYRALLKQRRQSMSTIRRRQAEQRACGFLKIATIFRSAKTIAAYISVNAEFRTSSLMLETLRQHKQLYLPVLRQAPQKKMKFAQLTAGSRLKKNRLGIPEPVNSKTIRAERLDLVILPLLGFDSAGNRMGMGGGFYDRSFAFCMQKKSMSRPFLLGLAYDAQAIEKLDAQPWDVPLDAVLTESGIRYFNHSTSPHSAENTG